MSKSSRRHYHWFQFDINSWKGDLNLQECSPTARCIWFEMIILMTKTERYGYLQINGKAMTVTQIATYANVQKYQVVRALKELEDKCVFSKDEQGIIFCRRMIREIHESNATDYATDHATKNQGKPPKAEFGLARAYAYKYNKYNIIYNYNNNSKLEKKEILKKKKKTSNPSPRGTLLPKDWQPDAEDRDYAIKLGLNPQITALKFFNHWTGEATGAKARKVSWKKTWQNWCLRAVEFSQGRNSYTPPMSNRERIGQKLDEMGKIIHLRQRAGQAQNTPNTQAYDPFENDEETLRLAFGE